MLFYNTCATLHYITSFFPYFLSLSFLSPFVLCFLIAHGVPRPSFYPSCGAHSFSLWGADRGREWSSLPPVFALWVMFLPLSELLPSWAIGPLQGVPEFFLVWIPVPHHGPRVHVWTYSSAGKAFSSSFFFFDCLGINSFLFLFH